MGSKSVRGVPSERLSILDVQLDPEGFRPPAWARGYSCGRAERRERDSSIPPRPGRCRPLGATATKANHSGGSSSERIPAGGMSNHATLMVGLAIGLLAFGIPASAEPCVGNPIAVESCLAGSPPSEWDVSGVGDSTIEGFATGISVNRGGTIGFKIRTDAAAYRIDIYRLGDYQGNGARKVADGTCRIAANGIEPLSGSGALLTVTIEALGNTGNEPPLSVSGEAIEGGIPLRVRGRGQTPPKGR